MIRFYKFSDFADVVRELKEQGKYVKLFGFTREAFYGFLTNNPKANTYNVEICALSDIGTFYFKDGISLKNSDSVDIVKAFFDSNSVTPSKFSEDEGVFNIK
jgi:hypothetical protein